MWNDWELFLQVVTGQFSWVDALGTRHVTVYRADASGYHVIEMRNEVGAVQIKPKNDFTPNRKIPQVQTLFKIKFC